MEPNPRDSSQTDQANRDQRSNPDPRFNPDGSLRGERQRDPQDGDQFKAGNPEPDKPSPDALGPLEIAHVRHILDKHFFQDKPEAPAVAAGSAGYCPLCPAAVTTTYTDGSAVCANGHRFPVQSIKKSL